MVVQVGEIVDDFAGRLEDLPIQPRHGRYRHGLRIPEPVGEFVGLMDVDVRGLGAHRFEFLVGLDGQQALRVPEALVVGVPGGDGGRGGQHEGTHEDALCVGLGQSSTDGFDEEHPSTKVQHDPEQDPVISHGMALNTSANHAGRVPHRRSPWLSSLQKSVRFLPYNSRKMLIEKTEMNQMWAR